MAKYGENFKLDFLFDSDNSDQAQCQSLKSSTLSSMISSEGGVTKEASSSSLRHNCNISIINMDNNNKTAKNTRRIYEAQVCANYLLFTVCGRKEWTEFFY